MCIKTGYTNQLIYGKVSSLTYSRIMPKTGCVVSISKCSSEVFCDKKNKCRMDTEHIFYFRFD